MRYVYVITLLSTSILLSYTLGIDQFNFNDIQNLGYTPHARIALVTNQTGRNSHEKTTLDVARAHNMIITAICAPEHGVDGRIQAGIPVLDTQHPETQIPIVSLYGHGRKALTSDFFNTFDLFVFHMQDAGMRHYTHVATLLYILELASTHNKGCIILDRPNPLGHIMEGPVIQNPIIRNGIASFLGSVPLPLRHGMTIGEIALFLNKHVLKKPAQLHVVALNDYTRNTHIKPSDCRLLSPNIPTKQSCLGYSFLGLLGEVRPFDVGIATDQAFCKFGLPYLAAPKSQWLTLKDILQAKGLISDYIEYERRNIPHQGLSLRAFDPLQSSSCGLFCDIIAHFKNCKITFSDYFDVAAGSEVLRSMAQNSISKDEGITTLTNQLKQFYAKAQSCFLYKPYPQMIIP